MTNDRICVEFKDYYQTLGVSRTATAEEIKKAFRNLARQYHPDVAKDKKTAEAKFKEINEAYEVLGDAEKRRQYDELGANWKDASRAQSGRRNTGRRTQGDSSYDFEFGGGTGFSDFFEQFFGRRRSGGSPFEGGRPGFGRGAARGSDIEGDILVSLTESLQGSIRSVTLRREDPTTGEMEAQTLRVRIPAGILEGQRIRVPGQGEPGMGGAPAGDLYLRVRFERHPEFEVRGSDLYHELDLAPWEAVLGTEVRVPTLEGSVALRIAAGTQTGQQLRVRGKGLSRGGDERGDLFVTIGIQVPKQITPEEKAAWENLAKSSSFNPR